MCAFVSLIGLTVIHSLRKWDFFLNFVLLGEASLPLNYPTCWRHFNLEICFSM